MTQNHEKESKFAAELARRVLGVEARVYDTDGRQRAPDVELLFPGGSKGMLELTKYVNPESVQLESRLCSEEFKFDPAGEYVWTIQASNTTSIKHLKEVYRDVILLCEQHCVLNSNDLPYRFILENETIRWLRNTGTMFFCHPTLPKVDDGGIERSTSVLPRGGGGGVADDWSDLNDALLELFATSSIEKRCKKLVETEADFRCLMVACDYGKLPFAIADLLNFGRNTPLPENQPPLPDGIDCLILTPRYRGQVLVWNRDQWSAHYPWDSE
jgi:hypothetical protein